METEKRAGQIDVIRGMAIIGVIFIHSSFGSRFDSSTLSVCAYLSVLFDWAVLAFFFLSGLLLEERQSFPDYLKKRFRSLLVPFLFYNLFYNLTFGLLQTVTGRHFPGFQWKLSLLWEGWFHSPAFQLYFLPYLFVVAVLLFCLCKIISFRWHVWMLVAGGVLMAAFYQHAGWPDRSFGPEWTKLPLYFIAFLLGVVCRSGCREKSKNSLALLLLPGMLLALASRQSCLQSLLVPPLIFLGVSEVRALRDSRLLQTIGRSSGAIYLWHTPIMLPAFTTVLALCHVPAMFNLGMSLGITITVCIWLRHAVKAGFEKSFKFKMPRSLIP